MQLSLVHFEVLGRVVMAVAVHEDVGPLVIFCVFEVVLIFARIDQSLNRLDLLRKNVLLANLDLGDEGEQMLALQPPVVDLVLSKLKQANQTAWV